jgi:C1A family cysteine protease
MTQNLTGLGRLHAPDERDKRFLVPRLVTSTGKRRKLWYAPPVMDQGNTSQCVAYSSTAWLAAGPTTNRMFLSKEEFYELCQKNDEWPGEDYDGTSVRAAMKVMKQLGFIDRYEWAFDVDTVANFVLNVGPMVMGTDWYVGMCDTDRKGYVEISGDNVGGHAWLVYGYDADKINPDGSKGAFRCQNSWGKNWGHSGGRFWITKRDMESLIRWQGEAATSYELKRAA